MKNFIVDNIGFIILGLLTLVEIVPIKISPLELIGKKMNKQLNDKVDEFKKETNNKIETIEEKIDINHQKQCKIAISDFVQDYLSGEHKTRSQWVAIRNLANEYIERGWNSEIKADALFLEKEYSKLFLEDRKKKEGK